MRNLQHKTGDGVFASLVKVKIFRVAYVNGRESRGAAVTVIGAMPEAITLALKRNLCSLQHWPEFLVALVVLWRTL